MLNKIIALLLFLGGVFLLLYGFFLTATIKGLITMLIAVVLMLVSLFLYNKASCKSI